MLLRCRRTCNVHLTVSHDPTHFGFYTQEKKKKREREREREREKVVSVCVVMSNRPVVAAKINVPIYFDAMNVTTSNFARW